MKKIALNLLAWLAGRVATKYKVKIVAITGSVGKTTAKEAIFAVLNQAYSVERSLYNANTEWGIAASVIEPGFEPLFTASGKARISMGQFIKLIWQAQLKLLFTIRYPQVLVLELAADRPGDIRWFNRWFKYDVAVITTIGTSHLEFYANQAQLTAEKLTLVDGLKPNGLVVVNGDCDECQEFINNDSRRKVTFGWSQGLDYRPEMHDGSSESKLHSPSEIVTVTLPIGRHFGLAGAMAMAVGDEFGLTGDQIRVGLCDWRTTSGRFEVKKSARWTIIDDTYNASPESMQSGLRGMAELARNRRVAILSGMRELGAASEAGHQQVGRLAAKLTDLLIVLGPEGELIAAGAVEAGMSPENIVRLAWNPDHPKIDEAISQLLPILQDGDTVLIKASRALGLDRLAEKLSA